MCAPVGKLGDNMKGKGNKGIYLKLENSTFMPLGCKLPKWIMRNCSSNLLVAVEEAWCSLQPVNAVRVCVETGN